MRAFAVCIGLLLSSSCSPISPLDAAADADADGDADLDSDADEDTSPACGNGVVETGELCDDGNEIAGDECEPDCLDGARRMRWIAGGGGCDGVDAHDISIDPAGIAVAEDGSIYFADQQHHRLRRLAPDGTVETVAGTGVQGHNGDGKARRVELDRPDDMAAGADGNIYFLDFGNKRIRSLEPGTGSSVGWVRTILGNGSSGISSCSSPLEPADPEHPELHPTYERGEIVLCGVRGFDISPDGVLFVAEQEYELILRMRIDPSIDPLLVERVAGTGNRGPSPDGTPAHSIDLVGIYDVAAPAEDSRGNEDSFAFTEAGTESVRWVEGDGRLHTRAGSFLRPTHLARNGNRMYVVHRDREPLEPAFNQLISVVDATDGEVRLIAGGGEQQVEEGVLALDAMLHHSLAGLTWEGDGPVGGTQILVSMTNQLWRFSVGDELELVAGNGFDDYCGDGGDAGNAMLDLPLFVTRLPDGTLVWTESGNSVVRSWHPRDGTIDTVAGSGVTGFSNGACSDARFSALRGIAWRWNEADGGEDSGAIEIIVAESDNHLLRRIVSPFTGDCAVDTLVGEVGECGSPPDNTPIDEALLCQPWDVAALPDNSLVVSELGRGDGDVTVLGRVVRIAGEELDVFVERSDGFVHPMGLAVGVDDGGEPTVLVTDAFTHQVREVTSIDEERSIEVVAGVGESGYSGDGGPPEAARFGSPVDVAFDAMSGDIFISDTYFNVIRMVHNGRSLISTVAGTGRTVVDVDGLDALDTSFVPYGITSDGAGGLYVADHVNDRIHWMGFEASAPANRE